MTAPNLREALERLAVCVTGERLHEALAAAREALAAPLPEGCKTCADRYAGLPDAGHSHTPPQREAR